VNNNKIKNNFIISSSILALAVALCYFAYQNLFVKVYSWHASQPETIQGGLELLVLFGISFAIIMVSKKQLFSSVIICFLTILYLKENQVLYPAIIVWLYVEIICFFGRTIIKFLNLQKKTGIRGILDSLILGSISWGLLATLLSLIGRGGFTDLRILTIVVFVISLFSKEYNFLFINLSKSFMAANKFMKSGCIFIISIVVMQLSKSNRALDYDSLWYGLRPQLALVGENSFFDNLGMTNFVHYYPKFYELLMVPISNLGEYSFIYSFTTFMYLFLIITIWCILKTLGISNNKSIFYTSLITTIPAITNMASTAKPDIFTTLFIVLSALYLIEWITHKKVDYLIFGISAALVSLGGKLTSYLYIPLLFLGFIIAAIIFRKFEKKMFAFENKNNIFVLIVSFLLFLLITYRTIKLTGYPIYPVLPSLWNLLGFKLKYPFYQDVSLMSESLTAYELLQRWYHIIIAPQEYFQFVMVWPSTLFILLVIIVLLFSIVFIVKNQFNFIKPSLFLFLAISPLLMSVVYYISTIPKGGDGNYFMAPIILICIAGVHFVEKLKYKKILIISLSLYIPIHLMIMLVSHPSWSWGTSTFKLNNLVESDFESETNRKNRLVFFGLGEIEAYIKNTGTVNNCVGFGNEQTLNELSCRFEDVPHIGSRLGNPNIIANENEFLKYLKWADTRYLILPKGEHPPGYDAVFNVIESLYEIQTIEIIEDTEFYLLDLKDYFIQDGP